MDKRISLAEAAEMVTSGSTLALGGMTLYRRPFAFVRALLHRFYQTGAPSGLTLVNFAAGLESDLLIGAGMIQRLRTCYCGLEIFGLAPMFSYAAVQEKLEIMEESEASLSSGLRAASAGISFIPGRGWVGTDMHTLRPDVKMVTDPYSGETLVAFPAIRPDVAVIHALRADPDGNAEISDHRVADEELAIASTQVIITAEEITPRLEKAGITAPFVTAVVHTPGGAAPSSCHPAYPLDGAAILAYCDEVSDPASFNTFIQAYLQE